MNGLGTGSLVRAAFVEIAQGRQRRVHRPQARFVHIDAVTAVHECEERAVTVVHKGPGDRVHCDPYDGRDGMTSTLRRRQDDVDAIQQRVGQDGRERGVKNGVSTPQTIA